MKICIKCGIDKRDDNYYTYYHSINKKNYTRNVCNKCMCKQIKEHKQRIKDEKKNMTEPFDEENIVQPEALESIVEDFSDNDDYRKCTMCGNHKLSEEFYQNKRTGYYHSRCKPCHNNYSGGKLSEYYQKKFETQGGSERILPKPGTYTDIYQEQQVSWLLDLIGWSKNNDVWVKEGIKTVQDGKIVWDKLPVDENLHYVTKKLALTDEQIAHIVQLRSNGFKMREIAVIYNCSRTTIGKILSNEEKRNS